MSQRRTLILVAAIAIGALASFMVWQYVNGVKDSAYADAQRVPVYLIKADVAKGSYGQEVADKAIERTEIPRKFLPPNAIRSLDDIRGKVAISNLVTNQIVVSDMFVDASNPEAQTSVADRLNKKNGTDQVAITLQVDQVHGVAGMLEPGDFVNIMLASPSTGGSTANGSSSSSSAAPADAIGDARYLFQKVQILAIDKNPVPLPGDSSAAQAASTGKAPATPATISGNTGMITLLVPAKAAQFLAAAPPGNLYLTLVARDYTPVALPPLTQTEKSNLPGESSDQLTPYGPGK